MTQEGDRSHKTFCTKIKSAYAQKSQGAIDPKGIKATTTSAKKQKAH